MQKTFSGLIVLGLTSLTLLADFSEPFTDSPANRSVTGRGWLLSDVDGSHMVMVRTDTGLRLLSAKSSSDFDVSPFLGRYALITATIRQTNNLRSLEISGITNGNSILKPTSQNEDAASQAAASHALDAAQVLAIARAAVATNDTWLDRAEFETPKQQTNGTWSVMVWRLPKQPGGHRFITVDANGNVTDYVRGR